MFGAEIGYIAVNNDLMNKTLLRLVSIDLGSSMVQMMKNKLTTVQGQKAATHFLRSKVKPIEHLLSFHVLDRLSDI